MYTDQFGFLGQRLDLVIEGGQIRTLPQFEDASAWVRKYANEDGYVYPPVETTSRQIDGTERLVALHRIPATHEIRLFEAPPDREAGRYGEGGFIAHSLAFLLGLRAQFSDWWVDGRIPTTSQNDYFIAGPPDIVSLCLDKARSRWRSWPPSSRTVFLNALYLHNRSDVYQWDWERFQAKYQVLDALCTVAKRCLGLKTSTHRQRFDKLCTRFGLFRNDALAKQVVSWRDDLLHSALWGGQVPGTAPDGGFHMPIWLHRFNQRLALAMLGFDCQYVRSNWHSLGSFAFLPGQSRAAPA